MESFGIRYPIWLSPMFGISTPQFAAAFSNAGGLGSVGAARSSPDDLRKIIQEIRKLTQRPFNINLFVEDPLPAKLNVDAYTRHLQELQKEIPFEIGSHVGNLPKFHDQVEALLSERIPVFSFTLGIPPKEVIREFQKGKTKVVGSATQLDEVLALEEAGVDAIVCQGKEAGGHRGTFLPGEAMVPTFDLLRSAHRATKKPLIAAGGIMKGQQIAQALREGAVAAQLGTLFLASQESGANPDYKRALLEWGDRRTLVTRAVSGRRARVVENRLALFLHPFERDAPPFPVPTWMLGSLRNIAAAKHDPEYMLLFAGEHFAQCKAGSVQSIIQELIADGHLTPAK